MIRLDTHVVVWLYTGSVEQLSKTARTVVDNDELTICHAVALELQFLHEIGRLRVDATDVVRDLGSRIGLVVADSSLSSAVRGALLLSWTRDPFDRLICGEAIGAGVDLLTKDRNIRRHLPSARW